MQLKSWALLLIFVGGASFTMRAEADQGPLWVQSEHADLKKAPQLAAEKVATLVRGDALVVDAKDGLWFKVKKGGTEGWISKIFVADHRPIGSADLKKDVTVTEEKTSRKRSSSYAVSASIRGLTSNQRALESRSRSGQNFQAVLDVDHYEVSQAELIEFKKSARLGEP